MFEKLGMKKMIDGADRLNAYMKSVDDDLRKISGAFNDNFTALFARLAALEKEVREMREALEAGLK